MHRLTLPLVAVSALLVGTTACGVMDVDPGPEMTHQDSVEAGTAEAIRAEIRMGAGEMNIQGGASKLLEAGFRYSERVGKPVVRYELTGFRGRLTVENPTKGSTSGNITNEWKLKLGGKVPLDLSVQLGAGKAQADLSAVPLRSLDVQMGAGELELNVAGNYGRDVEVDVKGGVGEARIKLSKNFGAVVDAVGGIGSIDASGLRKRDGKYYNDAYAEGKPAVRMKVRGGVGEIRLSVVE